MANYPITLRIISILLYMCIYRSVCQAIHQNVNSEMSLADLENIFTPKNRSYTSIYNYGVNIADELQTLSADTRYLSIVLRDHKNLVECQNIDQLNLTFISDFPSLEELWIIPEADLPNNINLRYCKKPKSGNIKRLSMNFLLSVDITVFKSVVNLLHSNAGLEVLSLKGTHFLTHENQLKELLNSLNMDSMIALSLSFVLNTGPVSFNVTHVFGKRATALQYIDLSSNSITRNIW